nr:hypothetical protein [Corallococcus sicarius]
MKEPDGRTPLAASLLNRFPNGLAGVLALPLASDNIWQPVASMLFKGFKERRQFMRQFGLWIECAIERKSQTVFGVQVPQH